MVSHVRVVLRSDEGGSVRDRLALYLLLILIVVYNHLLSFFWSDDLDQLDMILNLIVCILTLLA